MAHSNFHWKNRRRWFGTTGPLALLLLLLPGAGRGLGGEEFSEYRVKALFLYNFAKYVEWPATAFADSNAPVVIGVVGKDRFGDELESAVKGKTVNGRGFVIKHLAAADELSGCQMVFISNSESERTGEILASIGTRPILTVGEDKTFAANGGVIDFVLKDNRVRLQINLAAANRAGLKISSKLLAIADEVKR